MPRTEACPTFARQRASRASAWPGSAAACSSSSRAATGISCERIASLSSTAPCASPAAWCMSCSATASASSPAPPPAKTGSACRGASSQRTAPARRGGRNRASPSAARTRLLAGPPQSPTGAPPALGCLTSQQPTTTLRFQSVGEQQTAGRCAGDRRGPIPCSQARLPDDYAPLDEAAMPNERTGRESGGGPGLILSLFAVRCCSTRGTWRRARIWANLPSSPHLCAGVQNMLMDLTNLSLTRHLLGGRSALARDQ
jgi:hypothetical protein